MSESSIGRRQDEDEGWRGGKRNSKRPGSMMRASLIDGTLRGCQGGGGAGAADLKPKSTQHHRDDTRSGARYMEKTMPIHRSDELDTEMFLFTDLLLSATLRYRSRLASAPLPGTGLASLGLLGITRSATCRTTPSDVAELPWRLSQPSRRRSRRRVDVEREPGAVV